MKKLAIITEMHQTGSILKKTTPEHIIVVTRPEISEELTKLNISHKTIDDYGLDYEKIEEDSFLWMKEFPILVTLDGKTLKEILAVDDFSIWWLMENWLFYSSMYMDSFKQILETVSYVDEIIRLEKPDEILFVDDGKVASKIIKHEARALRIKIYTIQLPIFKVLYKAKKRFRTILIRYFIDFGFSIRKLRWNFLRTFYKTHYRGLQGKRRILFISTHGWGSVEDKKTGKTSKENPDITPLITELEKNTDNDVLSVGIQVGNFLDLDQMKQLAHVRNYRVLESYYNRNAKNKFKLQVKNIKEKWERIKKLNELEKNITYKGIPVWHLIEPQLSCYFSTRFKGHLREVFLIREMLSTERPSMVVYPAETSEFGRSLFYNCKKLGIPVMGIQHGIFDKNLACMHKKNEISLKKTGHEICPIPDITAVYGQFYKDMLVKNGNYPRKAVVVTGGQRFDRIINRKYNMELLCDKLGIDKNKKIIAYVTSPVPENEILARTVFETLKDIRDATLIVKIHPSEKDDLYKNVAAETGSDAVIVRDMDLYDILNACEIMITHLSTAGLEAMMFGKPVVILNLSYKPYVVSYVREGAAIGVYDKNKLKGVLETLLYDKKEKYRCMKKIEKSTKKFIYKNDGNASKRIVRIIDSFLK